MKLTWRRAGEADIGLLANWNYQLIRDEGHRHPMTEDQLTERMRGWLLDDSPAYRAVLFLEGEQPVAYAVYAEAKEIYMRQLFVDRARRREGVGRQVVQLLLDEVLPRDKRITVSALAANARAQAFWHAVGFSDYSVTLERLPAPR